MAFADAVRAINTMKAEGVIEEYAIAGAMAIALWTEPVTTWDLDVLVSLPGPRPPAGLEAIYRWTIARGYTVLEDHVIIEGVPTRFLASPGPLRDEAIECAATVESDDVKARVVVPEYLVALYLQPCGRTAKREERAALLLEWPGLNKERLGAILERHGLSLEGAAPA